MFQATLIFAGEGKSHESLLDTRTGVVVVSTASGSRRATRRRSSKEVASAHIYDGVHYRYSTEVGSAIGQKVGELVAKSVPKATR